MNKMKEYISKINSEIKELTKKYNKVKPIVTAYDIYYNKGF